MPRSYQVFDRLRDFPYSETDTVVLFRRKVSQPGKALTDLTRQLVHYPG